MMHMNSQRRSRGFVIIFAALTIILVIGVMGLVMDLARMYVARNELQAFADAATFGATMQLGL